MLFNRTRIPKGEIQSAVGLSVRSAMAVMIGRPRLNNSKAAISVFRSHGTLTEAEAAAPSPTTSVSFFNSPS